MPRNFNLNRLGQKLRGSLKPRPEVRRDARFVVRAVLGVLLVANLIAAWLVFRPWGGSAEDLELRLAELRRQVTERQAGLAKVRSLADKMDKGRKAGDTFITKYFFDRRTAYSTLLEELNQVAKSAGVRGRDHSYSYELVEGSETLGMLTVTANLEGSYADLLKMVNLLDKSDRFLIVESLAAAPQQSGGVLSVSLKLNTFVLETLSPLPAQAGVQTAQAGAGL